MKLHLEKYHKEEMKEFLSEEKTIAENKKKPKQNSGSGYAIADFFKPKQLTDCKSQHHHKENPYPEKSQMYRIKSDLTRLAGCTSFPLSIMDSTEFQTMLFNLSSRIADSLPSRNTLKSGSLNIPKK